MLAGSKGAGGTKNRKPEVVRFEPFPYAPNRSVIKDRYVCMEFPQPIEPLRNGAEASGADGDDGHHQGADTAGSDDESIGSDSAVFADALWGGCTCGAIRCGRILFSHVAERICGWGLRPSGVVWLLDDLHLV